MTRLHTFLSILCVVLAGTVGLVLALFHPGWAVRLVRYSSQSMVGGRCLPRRFPGGSRLSRRRSPASKLGVRNGKSVTDCRATKSATQRSETPPAFPGTGRRWLRVPAMWDQDRKLDYDSQSGNMQELQAVPENRLPVPEGLPENKARNDVTSTLVNLGMRTQDAGRLAKQAVVGRDFDGALRWAIANRRAA